MYIYILYDVNIYIKYIYLA